MKPWCFKILVALHLMSIEEECAKLDRVLEAAFDEEASYESIMKAWLAVPEFTRLVVQTEDPSVYLDWVDESRPDDDCGALYFVLMNLKKSLRNQDYLSRQIQKLKQIK